MSLRKKSAKQDDMSIFSILSIQLRQIYKFKYYMFILII